jgi:indoleamine 2,3-dioxygenase
VHPVATYAALNLWNWTPLSENADLTQPENMVALHTVSGSDDESWFFIISNAMEARAGPLIEAMLGAVEAVETNDVTTIIHALQYFRQGMQSIGQLLERMDERCDPQMFYHTIRPFLAGSMNMATAGLPNGVTATVFRRGSFSRPFPERRLPRGNAWLHAWTPRPLP